MAQLRIWHASRDPYHCAFRLLRVLAATKAAVSIERLRLLDMFLLYPPLLHRVSLPASVKERLHALGLARPEKIFIRLPSTASIWQDLQVYQSTALTRLGGMGILRHAALRERCADLNDELLPSELKERLTAANEEQEGLMRFLVHDLAAVATAGRDNLFKRAALPARGPVL